MAPNASCTAAYPSLSGVRTCVTTFGPAWTTVTGTIRLFSSKTWVIPSLVPRIPVTCLSVVIVSSALLDVDVDGRRQVDAHERVDRLRRRVEDVDEPLVGAHLEVLARVLVLVRRADDAVHVLLGRQRHRPDDPGSGARHRLDDLPSGCVDRLVVVGLQPDADLLSRHGRRSSFSSCRLVRVSGWDLREEPSASSCSGRTCRSLPVRSHPPAGLRSTRSGVSPCGDIRHRFADSSPDTGTHEGGP